MLFFLLTSCAIPQKCVIIEVLGVPDKGKRPYHVERVNGGYNDVVFLQEGLKEGDIVKVKIPKEK